MTPDLPTARALSRILVSLAIVGSAVTATFQQTSPPVWTKPDQFWFRKSVPGGHFWLNVDATHGVKEPLFDHQRLAIELTIRTGAEYTALTLPFADPAAEFVVKYDGSNAYIQEGAMAVEFVLQGQHWRCDLQTKWNWNKVPPTDYECLANGPAQPERTARTATLAPNPSPDGRWEAFIHQRNVAIRAAGSKTSAPIVLSTDGVAGYAYEPGSLQWAADAKSLSAYRVDAQVWLSDSLVATVKHQIAKATWTVPGAGR